MSRILVLELIHKLVNQTMKIDYDKDGRRIVTLNPEDLLTYIEAELKWENERQKRFAAERLDSERAR